MSWTRRPGVHPRFRLKVHDATSTEPLQNNRSCLHSHFVETHREIANFGLNWMEGVVKHVTKPRTSLRALTLSPSILLPSGNFTFRSKISGTSKARSPLYQQTTRARHQPLRHQHLALASQTFCRMVLSQSQVPNLLFPCDPPP